VRTSPSSVKGHIAFFRHQKLIVITLLTTAHLPQYVKFQLTE
jgi:hypothetical protein